MIHTNIMKKIKISFQLLPKLLRLYKLQKLIFTCFKAQAVFAFTRLGIADALSNGEKSLSEIAAKLNLHAQALERLLDFSVKLNLLKSDNNGRYKLSAAGKYLQANNPATLHHTVISMADLVVPAWANLAYTVQSGQAAFDKVFGAPFYDYVTANEEARIHFTRWMSETMQLWVVPNLELLDLSRGHLIIDVGGNVGEFMINVLRKYSTLNAIIFDRSYAKEAAQKNIVNANIQDRCRFIEGDFFASIPTGGDLYILARVLDNWNDEQALKILKNCRAAMPAHAKLIIIDTVHAGNHSNWLSLMANIHVLVMGEGVNRTYGQYQNLLQHAGFNESKLIKIAGPVSFIEASS